MTGEGLAAAAIRRISAAGVTVNDPSREYLGRYVDELARWGSRLHLVGRGRLDENIVLLLVDSWLLADFAASRGAFDNERPCRVADVGAGSGIPGVVLKIARPDLDVVLFERKDKLLRFLERVVAILGMPGLAAEGSDPVRKPPARPFDVVATRAAGRLPLALPLAAALLREGGTYITIKGDGWREELDEKPAGDMAFVAEAPLPANRGLMVMFRKRNATDG